MKHTVGYIQALGFAVLFMLYINGSIGWALIYAITGAVAASVISCAVSLNHFCVEVRNLSGEVTNGGEAEVQITVRKTGACFLPCAAVYFEGQKLLVDMPLLFRSENTRVLRIKMPDSGLCELRPSHIWASDFLSVVSLRAKRALAAAEPALTLGCFIANLFSPFGLYDIIFGTLATAAAVFPMFYVKNIWLAALLPVVSNGIIVGFELFLCGEPLWFSMGSVALGELCVIAAGTLLFRLALERSAVFMRAIGSQKHPRKKPMNAD